MVIDVYTALVRRCSRDCFRSGAELSVLQEERELREPAIGTCESCKEPVVFAKDLRYWRVEW